MVVPDKLEVETNALQDRFVVNFGEETLGRPHVSLGLQLSPPVSQSLLPASRAPMAQRGPNPVHAGLPCQKLELSATPKFRNL